MLIIYVPFVTMTIEFAFLALLAVLWQQSCLQFNLHVVISRYSMFVVLRQLVLVAVTTCNYQI
jgi:hypothetical protein